MGKADEADTGNPALLDRTKPYAGPFGVTGGHPLPLRGFELVKRGEGNGPVDVVAPLGQQLEIASRPPCTGGTMLAPRARRTAGRLPHFSESVRVSPH